MTYTGVKVFSATRAERRAELGDDVTSWSAANPQLKVVDIRVVQSSDNAYHCLSILVFYTKPLAI